MKSTITNAAEITILAPIDNNYKTGGGDISVGGACVIAGKGKPFFPMEIYGDTTDLEDTFGTPLPKKAVGMEGLRHVHDAIQECSYCNVVRVVNSLRYRFPSIAFLVHEDKGVWADRTAYKPGDIVKRNTVSYLCAYEHTSTSSNAPGEPGGTDWLVYDGPVNHGTHRYNESVVVGEGAFMVIYPVDGDSSVNRRIEIKDIDEDEKRFKIVVIDKDEIGEDYVLEQHTVGVSEDDKDDLGLSAYIETVLARDSEYFRCDYDEEMTWDAILPSLKDLATTLTVTKDFAFEGGTDGGTPELSDWQAGVNVFRNERVPLNLFFAAGCYEPDVLVEMADVADDRHLAFFYDVPPSLKANEAMEWNADMGLKSRHARAYYSPYAANDQWRGGKLVWGVSGAMAAAKARCNKIVTVGSTPGVHYAPAGESRSYLARTGIEALFAEDVINRDKFYDARINPILPITGGGCGADDDLTQHFKSNYLRFGWINDVLDYIDHRFYEAAQIAKFEPDGLTRQVLADLTREIMEQLVTSGALVPPRMPDRDGTSPYIITIEQLEIDLWKVTWEICITGAARRIVGQPKLIK